MWYPGLGCATCSSNHSFAREDLCPCNLPPSLCFFLVCVVVSESLWLHGLWPTRILSPWDFPGKSTGMGCNFLLQGIFLTQGLNPLLLCLHCRQILYLLSHWGRLWMQLKLTYRSMTCIFSFILVKNCKDGSTLAWKIPWTEEPGGLQSMGSLGVGHDWATSLSLFTFMYWRRKCQPTPEFLPGESQGWGSLVGCRLRGHTESDTTEAT